MLCTSTVIKYGVLIAESHRRGRGPLKTQLKAAWFHADQLNALGLGAVWQ